jgi:hypothetical protein
MINFSILIKLAGSTAVLATTLFYIPKAQAAAISLNFENIDNRTNRTFINNFYNGGTSSNGFSGTNYGVTFSPSAVALTLNTLTDFPSGSSRGGQGDPNSQRGGLFFLSAAQTFINYADGFNTEISFFYSAILNSSVVNVYDDLNATGNLLATLNLPITPSLCPSEFNAPFCPFFPISLSFAGTAKSIGFERVANQIVFDDVTFGSGVAGTPVGGTAVPEPLTIVGTLIGAGTAFRMRKRLKATNKL